MGLITGILSSPVNGIMFIFDKVRQEADRELYDETLWQQKLLDLQFRYELGDISQEAYEAQEAAILAQLDLINSLLSEEDDEDDDEDELEEDEDAEEPELEESLTEEGE